MQIIEQVNKILSTKPDVKISIIISDNNICSKTLKLLSNNNIKIISE